MKKVIKHIIILTCISLLSFLGLILLDNGYIFLGLLVLLYIGGLVRKFSEEFFDKCIHPFLVKRENDKMNDYFEINILCGKCRTILGTTKKLTKQESEDKNRIVRIQLKNSLYPMVCENCGNTGWGENQHSIITYHYKDGENQNNLPPKP